MKTLYLLRHLKSSWDDPALPDGERPLAPRGRRAGKKLARHLRRTGVAPQLVLCSPSVRTRETLKAVLPALGDPEVRFPAELYAAEEEVLLDALRSVEPRVTSILMVGHNPGLQDLALSLAGSGDDDGRRRLGEKLPTGALVMLEFRAGPWSEIGPSAGKLVSYVVPSELS